jgi:nitrite reductase/ring-hydroxylating ferredoxin subunit
MRNKFKLHNKEFRPFLGKCVYKSWMCQFTGIHVSLGQHICVSHGQLICVSHGQLISVSHGQVIYVEICRSAIQHD